MVVISCFVKKCNHNLKLHTLKVLIIFPWKWTDYVWQNVSYFSLKYEEWDFNHVFWSFFWLTKVLPWVKSWGRKMKSHPMGAFFPRVAGIVQIQDKDFKPPWQKFSFEKKKKGRRRKKKLPSFCCASFPPSPPCFWPCLNCLERAVNVLLSKHWPQVFIWWEVVAAREEGLYCVFKVAF